MTSHLNELEKRGYISRAHSEHDKREQLVYLTADYGEKFKLNLLQVTNDLERRYTSKLGEVELNRVELMLENLYRELLENQKKGSLL